MKLTVDMKLIRVTYEVSTGMQHVCDNTAQTATYNVPPSTILCHRDTPTI